MLLTRVLFLVAAIPFSYGLLGSRKADPQKYPFLVAVETRWSVQEPEFASGQEFEYGALLTMSWVLSTGFLDRDNRIYVWAGFQHNNNGYFERRGQVRKSVLLKKHPRKKLKDLDYFISLLKVDRPFDKDPFVSTLKLPKSSDVSQVCDTPILMGITRWGYTKGTEIDKLPILKLAEVPIKKGKSNCQFKGDLKSMNLSICSVGTAGPTLRDEGTPLICDGDTVVGLTYAYQYYDSNTTVGLYVPVSPNVPFIKECLENDVESTTVTGSSKTEGLKTEALTEVPFSETPSKSSKGTTKSSEDQDVIIKDLDKEFPTTPSLPDHEVRAVGRNNKGEEDSYRSSAVKLQPCYLLKFLVTCYVLYIFCKLLQ